MVEVGEVYSGTRGSKYLFVIKDDEIIHVSQLKGAKCISKEGKRKKIVIWSIPESEIANCTALWIDFAMKGHFHPLVLKLPDEIALKRLKRLDPLKYVSTENIFDVLNSISKGKLEFRLFGGEKSLAEIYFKYVPKLVEDFWRTMRSVGISHIHMRGGGHRLEEVLQDPRWGYTMSMYLPSEQGRKLSLYKKLSAVFELWILSKVIRALNEFGEIIKNGDWIYIKYTKNNKVVEFNINGRKYAVFYQPSIIPHIISGFLSDDELQKIKKQLGIKKFHIIPDLVIAENVEEYLDWGDLHKIKNKVRLVIEAKLSLKGISKYETLEVTESQVEVYTRLLNSKALVIILEPNEFAKLKLQKGNVKVIDDALNNVEGIINAIKEVCSIVS